MKKILFIVLSFFYFSCGVKKSSSNQAEVIKNHSMGEDIISSAVKPLKFNSEVQNSISSNDVDAKNLEELEDEEAQKMLSLILFLDD